jgi:hypothetical protein
MNAVGAVVFLGAAAFLLAPQLGSDGVVDHAKSSAGETLQDYVYAAARKDPARTRIAVGSAAASCAETFSDIYRNPTTPKVMSRIYGTMMNRFIREKPGQSTSEQLTASVSQAIIKQFGIYRDLGVEQSDPTYGALGLVNIGFDYYNVCVYKTAAEALAKAN